MKTFTRIEGQSGLPPLETPPWIRQGNDTSVTTDEVRPGCATQTKTPQPRPMHLEPDERLRTIQQQAAGDRQWTMGSRTEAILVSVMTVVEFHREAYEIP